MVKILYSVALLGLVALCSANFYGFSKERTDDQEDQLEDQLQLESKFASNNGKNNNNKLGELLLLQVIFRHGDRTPVFFPDDDPYKDYDYPEGLGGLSRQGKERLFRYGQKLRNRYRRYLRKIQSKNIMAQSSPTRRVAESSEALLAGLFTPRPEEIWSRDSDLAKLWQPIQVVTASVDQSYLVGEGGPCPIAANLLAQQNSLPQVEEFWNQKQDFIARVNQFSGLNITVWSTVAGIYDTLYCEKGYFGKQYKPPKWLSQVGKNTMAQMKQFRELGFELYGWLPREFLRLKAGPFLKELTQNFNATASNQPTQPNYQKNRQLFAYGTHDTVLSMILHALGFFTEQPSYGSGVIFELRSNAQAPENPIVYLNYANVTDNFRVYPLSLNESVTFRQQCPNAYCLLDGFIESLLPYIPEDVVQECGVAQ